MPSLHWDNYSRSLPKSSLKASFTLFLTQVHSNHWKTILHEKHLQSSAVCQREIQTLEAETFRVNNLTMLTVWQTSQSLMSLLPALSLGLCYCSWLWFKRTSEHFETNIQSIEPYLNNVCSTVQGGSGILSLSLHGSSVRPVCPVFSKEQPLRVSQGQLHLPSFCRYR